jgi:DNA-binding LacI/PurR family transcriptional regulator
VRHPQRITILDVAARAGVHAATVSRTLNLPERVAPETRQRVEAAVRELGFVPNRAARGLITGRTGNVAIIVPDITNPHFASLVRAVERTAREAELQVLLVDTGEHQQEEVRAAKSLAREVDGFIAISPRRLHRELDVLGPTPVVFVNRPVRHHSSVLFRTAPAVAEALHHLESNGHHALAYLGGPSASWAAGERRTAVRQTARKIGFEVEEIVVPSPTFEAAFSMVERVVESAASAVVAFNDQMALGVIAGLSNLGVSVPADISVVGFDDVPMAAMVAPPLTTISMPTDEAGSVAVEMLREGLASRELFGRFVMRHSSGPVSRGRANVGATRGRRASDADRA